MKMRETPDVRNSSVRNGATFRRAQQLAVLDSAYEAPCVEGFSRDTLKQRLVR